MENLFLLNRIMRVLKTKFDNLFLITLETKSDFRGNFSRLFCKKIFSSYGVNFKIKQVSLATNTSKHTLRGMHFQEHPKQEQKLLCCIKGKIWDVVVDVRKWSPTFGQWQHFELNHKNCLFIPKGFAHGYITITNKVEIIYFMDELYELKLSKGIIWNDKSVGINWPFQPKVISKNDQNLSYLHDL